MILKKHTNNVRSLLTIFAMFALAITVLWLGANNSKINAASNGDVANSPEATFAGTGVGAIPDGTATGYGAPLVVSFAVSGVSGNVTDVSLNMTLTHTWVGDIDAVLTSPGGTRSLVIFSRVGSITATGLGDSSNLGGTYTFSDTASGTNIWTVATDPACLTDCIVAPGTYRTTAAGGAGQTNPAPVTSLNTTFAGLTPAQANGTWTLTFRDGASTDTGSVTAANLTINPTGSVARGTLFDFTGDNRTDFTVLTLPTTGPITWKTASNPAPAGPNQAFIRIFNYGQNGGNATSGDRPVAYDFTGDNKSEVTVWRPGSPGNFYVAQFPNGTGGITLERAVPLGQSGDNPRPVGDYDGDGKVDFTVARLAGSVITYYRLNSATNTFSSISITAAPNNVSVLLGIKGADFNNDGRDEIVLAGLDAGNFVYWYIFDSITGAPVITRQFGDFNSDYLVSPADYTGDGRADFVSVRQSAQGQVWYINNSATNAVTATVFGLSDSTTARLDYNVRGDFDGDGRQDIAVWRISNQTFYWINSSNGSIQGQQWGSPGDIPLGNDGVF